MKPPFKSSATIQHSPAAATDRKRPVNLPTNYLQQFTDLIKELMYENSSIQPPGRGKQATYCYAPSKDV